jgi:Polyketide cyclase / dehydrase and lipid transport
MRGLLAAGLVAAVAAPAMALDAAKQVEVAASPAEAWAAIGDFCGIGNWHPAVAGCVLSEQDGAKLRTLSLNGGGTIVEKLTAFDDGQMRYSY